MVRGFLGLAGYYCKFFHDYGVIAAPLIVLTKKDGFSWTEEAAAAFLALKSVVTSASVLALPDFDKPFIVECDASTYGFSAVLLQDKHPLAFFSRPVAARHRALAAYERELGLVLAIHHWRLYHTYGAVSSWYAPTISASSISSTSAWRPFHSTTGWASSSTLTSQWNTSQAPPTLWQTPCPAATLRRGSCLLFPRPASTTSRDFVKLSRRIPPSWQRVTRSWLVPRGAPWGLCDGMVTFDSRLYIPPSSPLLHKVLATIHEDGHEGVQRTLHHLRRDFHFPDMRRMVQDFVRACNTCQRYKSEHLHPAGLLLPLPVPTTVWADIGLDFVEALPRVGGKSVILTVVNRFSKYCHFIPLAHPYSAESVAQAFFKDIICLHGVPQSMVSDRDPMFTSTFWRELMRLIGTKLHMTTAFHPQSNGQIEAANRVIFTYLRCFTGDRPRQWVRWLPSEEYIYNTGNQMSLRDTPFRVVYGRDPRTIRSYEPGETRVAAVAQNMADREEFLANVCYRLEQAQAVHKKHYDKLHRPISYAVGDWVLLRLRHRAPASLPQVTKGKLKPRYYGPYCIIELINPVAVCLKLPLRAKLHDVFHVGLLKKFVGPVLAAPPALPAIHHGAVDPELEHVVRSCRLLAPRSRCSTGAHSLEG